MREKESRRYDRVTRFRPRSDSPYGRLNGAVAPSDHQDVVPLIRGGIEQAVHDLALLFAGDPEFARCPAPAQWQGSRSGGVRRDRRAHLIARFTCLHTEHFLVRANVQLRLLEDLFPEREQFFLGDFAELHAAPERQFEGRGQHDLAARVVQDRPADRLLLERDVPETCLMRRQGRRQSGRARTDNDNIILPRAARA